MECKVCKEEIIKGAKKCIHCDSFQDYRRNVHLSTTFLSLIVALATILSFGIPYVKKSLENPDSNIKTHILGINPRTNEIDVYCVNEGKRPGLVHGANFEFEHNDKTYYITLRRQFAKVENKDIVKEEQRKERDLYELYPFKTVLMRFQPLKNAFPRNIENPEDRFTNSKFKKNEIKNICLRMITTSFKGKGLHNEDLSDKQNIDSLFFRILTGLPTLKTN